MGREAAELEQRASLANRLSAETECLRAEIQTLTADLSTAIFTGGIRPPRYMPGGTAAEQKRK